MAHTIKKEETAKINIKINAQVDAAAVIDGSLCITANIYNYDSSNIMLATYHACM